MPDPDLFHGLLHTASALAEEGMKKEEECPPDNLKGFFHFRCLGSLDPKSL